MSTVMCSHVLLQCSEFLLCCKEILIRTGKLMFLLFFYYRKATKIPTWFSIPEGDFQVTSCHIISSNIFGAIFPSNMTNDYKTKIYKTPETSYIHVHICSNVVICP